jgi:hypothetical protein
MIGNGTPDYPQGDTIQVVEPWKPPPVWDFSDDVANAILDDIDRGLTDGRRYSDHNKAGARHAWHIVQKHCPSKPEAPCREIIRAWIKNELLEVREYDDPTRREKVKGLFVNAAKRPGAQTLFD